MVRIPVLRSRVFDFFYVLILFTRYLLNLFFIFFSFSFILSKFHCHTFLAFRLNRYLSN